MTPATPLLRPHRYFAERDDALRTGGIVFVGYVLASVLRPVAVLVLITSRMNGPNGVASNLAGVLVVRSIPGVLVALVGWFVVGGAMHYLSGGDETPGTYDDALAVAGWAYAPNAVAIPVELGFARRRLAELDPAADFDAAVEAVAGAGVAPMEFLVLLGVAAWSAYVLARGTAATHDVPAERTVGPAVAVGFASFILSLL